MLLILAIILLFSISFSSHAEWIESNEPLKLNSVKPKLCSEFTASNETDISIDSETCLKEAHFLVLQKYITTHEGKKIITLMRLKIQVQNVQCDGKIKKVFGHYYVNHRGEIIYQKPSFEVTYVDNCELITNILVLDSYPGEDHVIKLSKREYYKLSKKLRREIESLDLSILLEAEIDVLSKKYFKVLDQNNQNITSGYIVSFIVEDIINEEQFEVIARFNTRGSHIGELEYK